MSRRATLVLIALAILLIGADPTPSFLGVAPPTEGSRPTPIDRSCSSGFVLPVGVAVAAPDHPHPEKDAGIHLGPAPGTAPASFAPLSSIARCRPLSRRASDASFGSAIRLRC